MKTNQFFLLKLYLIIGILLLIGCQKQIPIEIIDQEDDLKLIQLQPLATSTDPIFIQSGIDTTGIFGIENVKYAAKMFFAAIRYNRQSRNDSLFQAEAIFLDKRRPIKINGKLLTYASFDVGEIKINDLIINKLPHIISIPPLNTDSIIGYRYKLRAEYKYEESYKWICSGKYPIVPFEVTINKPLELRVLQWPQHPIKISESVNFKWQCKNPFVNIIISLEDTDGINRKLIPVLCLRVQNIKNGITLSPKIMETLPVRKSTKYVFTFSSDSKLIHKVEGFSDDILVHSASIHNIYLIINP